MEDKTGFEESEEIAKQNLLTTTKEWLSKLDFKVESPLVVDNDCFSLKYACINTLDKAKNYADTPLNNAGKNET